MRACGLLMSRLRRRHLLLAEDEFLGHASAHMMASRDAICSRLIDSLSRSGSCMTMLARRAEWCGSARGRSPDVERDDGVAALVIAEVFLLGHHQRLALGSSSPCPGVSNCSRHHALVAPAATGRLLMRLARSALDSRVPRDGSQIDVQPTAPARAPSGLPAADRPFGTTTWRSKRPDAARRMSTSGRLVAAIG